MPADLPAPPSGHITDRLRERSVRILELLDALLEQSTLRNLNESASGVVHLPGYAWGKLDTEGRRLQSRVLNELAGYTPLVEFLIRNGPSKIRKNADAATKTLQEIVDQSRGSGYSSIDRARNAAHQAVDVHLDALDSLDDPSDGQPIFVPDANAAIVSPAFDEWTFEGVTRFALVLTPTFLSELDDLKTMKRVDDVRQTAEAAINRIKEYRRRGDIQSGVVLRKGRSTIRLVATEADFARTLPRLDRAVADDRLIAETLEIIRQHPRSLVMVVTGDINLQNKAAAIGIGFVEPPEAGRRERRGRELTSDVQILSIRSTGGAEGEVTFAVEVQNLGSRPHRATLRAFLGETEVGCQPEQLDLLVNHLPDHVRVLVPRPRLGDLVSEFANETTLYGGTLRIEVMAGGRSHSATWDEIIYAEETNAERYRIQQRIWRIGRGEGTQADARAQMISDGIARRDRELGIDEFEDI